MRLGPVDVTLFPPRCYVFRRRVHHFWLGLLLIVHDRRDWRVWVSDFLRHPDVRR